MKTKRNDRIKPGVSNLRGKGLIPNKLKSSKRILRAKPRKIDYDHQLSDLLSSVTKKWELREPAIRVTIGGANQAYFELLSHWDKRALYFNKSYRILVVGPTDDFHIELSIEPKNENLAADHVLSSLRLIHKLEPDARFYITQNNPLKSVVPTEKETRMARSIRNIANQEKLKVVDQLIMSNNEVFSFEENDYMENNT